MAYTDIDYSQMQQEPVFGRSSLRVRVLSDITVVAYLSENEERTESRSRAKLTEKGRPFAVEK